MSARVSEVKAFKAIDDEVFDTFLKAHQRNVWVLLQRLLGEGIHTFEEGERLHRYLHSRLCDARDTAAKQAILDLAEEIQ